MLPRWQVVVKSRDRDGGVRIWVRFLNLETRISGKHWSSIKSKLLTLDLRVFVLRNWGVQECFVVCI